MRLPNRTFSLLSCARAILAVSLVLDILLAESHRTLAVVTLVAREGNVMADSFAITERFNFTADEFVTIHQDLDGQEFVLPSSITTDFSHSPTANTTSSGINGSSSAKLTGSFGLVDLATNQLSSFEFSSQAAGAGQYDSVDLGNDTKATSGGRGVANIKATFMVDVETPFRISGQGSITGSGESGFFFPGGSVGVSFDSEQVLPNFAGEGILMPGLFELSAFSVAGEESSGTASLSFLLTFGVGQHQIRWTKATGGLVSDNANWRGGIAPTTTDAVLFDLASTYIVDFAGQDAGAILGKTTISAGNVKFDKNGASLPRQLIVDNATFGAQNDTIANTGQGSVSVVNGGKYVASLFTMASRADSEAQLLISGTGSQLTTSNLMGGISGHAKINVEDGGRILAGRLFLGGDDGGFGEMVVAGSETTLTVLGLASGGDGFLIVGNGAPGRFDLLDGAKLTSGATRIGWPDLSIPFPIPDPDFDPRNRTTGPGSVLVSGRNTLWVNRDSFLVGGFSDGSLVVEDGARIETVRFEVLGNYNDFFNSAQFTGNDTSLESGSVDVGRRGVLIFERGATFSASLLSVFGRTSLSGPNVSGTINGLSSAVVVYSGGELLINDGADLTSISTRNTIGSGDPEGPLALVRVAGDGSVWDAGLADIRIAISPSGRESGNGELRVEDGAIVRANRVLIGTGGVVGGNRGIVEADLFVLGGQLLPGNSPGLLTIDGDLNVDIDSTIVIEIAGTGSVEAYDVVDVTGDAIVDGMIVLKFIDGFAPTAGDQFEFLRVGGVVDLADTLFDVQGLQPGFEFEIMPTSSGMQVLALNNGVASVPEPSSFTIIALMLFTALQHSSRFSGQMCLHRSAS